MDQVRWQRPKGRAPLPHIPPLLLWVQRLVDAALVPPDATHVALRYVCIMQGLLQQQDTTAAHRRLTANLLRGTVSAAKAHHFLHMVMSDVPDAVR